MNESEDSLMLKRPAIQQGVSGLIPTSSLHFQVVLCQRKEIKDFIEKYHYSHNINGLHSEYCFKLMDNNKIIGACIYGKLAMHNQWKKYVEKEEDIIELRRLVLIDDTPKNTESYFIGYTIRWLKKNTNLKKIISYADPEYGHSGIIYKASNFKLVGQSAKGRVIFYNNKKYHDKTIRTKYNEKLKPFAQKVKDALESGEAYYKNTQGKNIYLYTLKDK